MVDALRLSTLQDPAPLSFGMMVGTVRWRVAYGLLMPVIDGDLGGVGPPTLQGEFTRLPNNHAPLRPMQAEDTSCADDRRTKPD